MSREYLKNLNDKISLDPSEIKQLIQDIPKISDTVIFSNFPMEEDKEMFCNVLETLLKRISISARRSKQAFTSMWDNLKKFLEIVLNDALKLELGSRTENMNKIMRQILQLGIKPKEGQGIIFCDCNWLGMDLDTQMEKLKYSHGIEHLNILENDLNLKTFSLFCEKFQVPNFSKAFLKLSNSNSTIIIDLFFKKYYDHQIICEYILSKDSIPLEVIINLKNLPCSELIKFPCDIINILISKINPLLMNGDIKEQLVVFELLSAVSESLDYRIDNNLDNTLTDIVNNYNITTSDPILSKYWSFVSSILSSERVEVILISSLEPKILHTLKAESMLKSKISICRVISLYWSKINDKSSLFELLLKCANSNNINNKLKWNITVALMNYKCSDLEFNIVKTFWLNEMRIICNYKVMYSWTNLLLKWSVLYQYDMISDPDDENTIWNCLNHLKLFISANSLNLECEDGENIVESASKLEMILKSILIGPNLKGLN